MGRFNHSDSRRGGNMGINRSSSRVIVSIFAIQAVFLGTIIVVGAQPAAKPNLAEATDIITAKEICLKDDKGVVRAKIYLSGEKQNPVLTFHDSEGRMNAWIGSGLSGGQIGLQSSNKDPSGIEIVATTDHTHVVFTKGKRELVQIVSKDGDHLFSMNEDGKSPRVKLSVVNGKSKFEMRDKDGVVYEQPFNGLKVVPPEDKK